MMPLNNKILGVVGNSTAFNTCVFAALEYLTEFSEHTSFKPIVSELAVIDKINFVTIAHV